MPSKKRWSEEEISRMAMVEARLVIAGNITNVNQEVLGELPYRSIEAIKGKRKPLTYKKRVEDLVKALRLELRINFPPPREAIA